MNTVVKRLLGKGALRSINTINSKGETPLYLATEGYGNLELIKYLHDMGASLDNVESINTLVNAAACANKTDLVMYFISLKVDYVKADWHGVTSLHNAAMNNNLDLVNYFLDQGKIDVNALTNDLRTALYYAIQYYGDINVVNSLLDKFSTTSIDLNSWDNLLTLAIEQNKSDIAQTLLLANVNIEYAGVSRKTPLYQAIYSDNVQMVKQLLDRGADYNSDIPDSTPIELMIKRPSDRSIKFFAYDYKDKHKQTMLHLMAAQNKVKVVKTLLERGAYVDVQDSEGNSPLHLAAKNGNLEIVQKMCELKQNCINVGLLNANKQTALDLARLNNKTEVVEFLEHWHPIGFNVKQRARRQFSVPPASSSAGRATWWISDLMGAIVGTFKSITKQTSQSVLFSSYQESASPHSIFSQSQSVNVHGTLLLLDVLARKFTGQVYVGTDRQSVSLADARSNSLVIVKQFERMLNLLANETKSQLVFELDSFELYRTVENCFLSGQFSKIDRVLLSIARDALPSDSIEDSLIVRNVEELLIEALSENRPIRDLA